MDETRPAVPAPVPPTLSVDAVEKPETDIPIDPAPRWRRFAWVASLLALALVYVLLTAEGQRLLRAYGSYQDTGEAGLAAPKPEFFYPRWQSAQRKRMTLIFQGDPTRATTSAQVRAVWEQEPTNQVYYARYALALSEEYDAGIVPPETYRQAMRQGLALDPRNALYDYLLARRLFAEAIASYDVKGPGYAQSNADAQVTYPGYRITDRALFDEALAHLLSAVKKPVYTTYPYELCRAKIATLPAARHADDYLVRLWIASGMQYSNMDGMRSLTRNLPFCAMELQRQGRSAEAVELVGAWRPIARQAAGQDDMMIPALVGFSLARMGSKQASYHYQDLGRPDLAAPAITDHTRLEQEYQRLVNRRSSDKERYLAMLRERTGVMLAIVAPVFGERYHTQAELAPMRDIEYTLVEMLLCLLLLGFLTTMMLHHWIRGVRWRLAGKGMPADTLLIAPAPKTFLLVLGLTVVLPVLLYVAFTRWSGWAGREYNLVYNNIAALLPMLLVVLLVWVLPIRLMVRHLRQRCQALGVAVPTGVRWSRVWLFPVLLGWLAALYYAGMAWPGLLWCWGWGMPHLNGWHVLLAFAGCVALFGLRLLPALWWRPSPYRIYDGAMARSLVPVYACIILLVGLLTLPALLAEEQRCLRDDRLLINHDYAHTRTILPLEGRFAVALRECLLTTLGHD